MYYTMRNENQQKFYNYILILNTYTYIWQEDRIISSHAQNNYTIITKMASLDSNVYIHPNHIISRCWSHVITTVVTNRKIIKV